MASWKIEISCSTLILNFKFWVETFKKTISFINSSSLTDPLLRQRLHLCAFCMCEPSFFNFFSSLNSFVIQLNFKDVASESEYGKIKIRSWDSLSLCAKVEEHTFQYNYQTSKIFAPVSSKTRVVSLLKLEEEKEIAKRFSWKFLSFGFFSSLDRDQIWSEHVLLWNGERK